MTLRLHSLIAYLAFAFALPPVVRADTVYYSGGSGIRSVSGTILQESDGSVQIKTEEGRTVSISKKDVFQIIRDTDAAGNPMSDPFKATRESRPPTFDSELGFHLDFDEEPPSRITHYGIKGGVNFSNMSVDPQALEDHDSLRSFAVGAWWAMPLNRRFAFSTEAFYSVKGDAESADGYTASTRMSYLDVPVLAKIGFLQDGSVQPSLFLGPALALNLTAKSKLEGEGTDTEIDVKDQVRKLDLGVVVGGGVDFPMAGRTFGVEVRYSKGLSNAADESANGTAHNDVLAVMGSIGLQ